MSFAVAKCTQRNDRTYEIAAVALLLRNDIIIEIAAVALLLRNDIIIEIAAVALLLRNDIIIEIAAVALLLFANAKCTGRNLGNHSPDKAGSLLYTKEASKVLEVDMP